MSAPPPAEPRVAGRGYRRVVLALLMLVYTCNSAQRSLIPVIGQAMKVDLKLTDTELGLLAGTAFAALYAVSGVPTARLAERFSRVGILSIAIALWSAFTTLIAFTGSFTQLVIARIGVGVGEAGCSPCAHSLISDYYERTRRTSALAVYSCGLSLGYLFVAFVGGYVTLHYGWRAACIAVGAPGILMALLFRLLVREPPRGMADGVAAPTPAPFSFGAEWAALRAVARALFLTWPAANVVLGLTIASFASYGSWAFLPAYFPRAFGLDYATSGLVLGLAGSIPVALGTLAGGFLTDFLGARSAKWYVLVPAAGLLIATPFYLAALAAPRWQAAALLLAVPGFFNYISLAPSFGVVQNVVPARQRATATALLFLCLNVLALGGGALFTGFLIDQLAQSYFAHPHGGMLASLAQLFAPGAASFRSACPGGAAAAGAPAALAGACARALVQGSRSGILITLTFYLWAALHYLAAAFGLERQLSRSAAQDARARAA
jgi:predicted MFS family arabinose efflux permease